MQKISDAQFLYSPSDLVHFLSCHHSTVLDLKSFAEAMEKAEESASNRLLQKKGFEHEAAYLEQLKKAGKKVVEIPKEPKLPERVELTRQALQSGADVVYQGVLFKDNWRGDADFLIRVDKCAVTPMCCNTFPLDIRNMIVLFRRQDGESALENSLSPLRWGNSFARRNKSEKEAFASKTGAGHGKIFRR